MCALPKNFRKNLSIIPDKFGQELRKEMLDDVMDNGTFLPSGTIGGAICSSTELYQCGTGRYIAGDGQNATRYGFRKTPLPWDVY
jgi:hypothetical protein